MYDVVHVDEKWFYITEENMTVYLAHDEPEPERHCKSKRYIGKIMFLCAVARPRLLPDGTWWDGKIGIWPFTEQVAAKRSSVNRDTGTLETKPINVNRTVYKDFLLNKVVPAIWNLWPGGAPQYPIYIQQDNAPAHISEHDPDFLNIACLPMALIYELEISPPTVLT